MEVTVKPVFETAVLKGPIVLEEPTTEPAVQIVPEPIVWSEPTEKVEPEAVPAVTTPVVTAVEILTKNVQYNPQLREWDVQIPKEPTDGLGLDVDYGDKFTLKILRVKEGIVQKFNEESPSFYMQPRDLILSVNGVSGCTDKIVAAIEVGTVLDIKLQRPREWTITLEKESKDASLGIDVDLLNVTVLRVNAGCILNYNNSLEADQENFKIKPGDKIVEVNGMRTPTEILDQIKCSQTLKICVLPR